MQADTWVILKVKHPVEDYYYYKVLAGAYGGYSGSDTWQMNSGIVSVDEDQHCYYFNGVSGSVYECPKCAYKLSGLTASVLNSLQIRFGTQAIVLMDKSTNWKDLDYVLEANEAI